MQFIERFFDSEFCILSSILHMQFVDYVNTPQAKTRSSTLHMQFN